MFPLIKSTRQNLQACLAIRQDINYRLKLLEHKIKDNLVRFEKLDAPSLKEILKIIKILKIFSVNLECLLLEIETTRVPEVNFFTEQLQLVNKYRIELNNFYNLVIFTQLPFNSEICSTMTTPSENISLLTSIREFSGEDESQSLEQYLGQIKMVSNLGHWSDKTKKTAMLFKLSGRAAAFANLNHVDLLPTAEDVEKALKSAFSPTVPQASLLKNTIDLNKRKSESIPEFGGRVLDSFCQFYKSLGMDINNIPQKANTQIVSSFLNGLDEQTKQFLIFKEPQTIQVAIQQATSYQNQIQNPSINLNNKEDITQMQTQIDKLTTEVIAMKINPVKERKNEVYHVKSENKRSPREKVTCQICGKINHTAINCYKRNLQQQLNSRPVYNFPRQPQYYTKRYPTNYGNRPPNYQNFRQTQNFHTPTRVPGYRFATYPQNLNSQAGVLKPFPAWRRS